MRIIACATYFCYYICKALVTKLNFMKNTNIPISNIVFSYGLCCHSNIELSHRQLPPSNLLKAV